MATTEQSIDVEAPIRTVYNQWTQFEDFPQFMGDVESVEQIDDRHLHWRLKVAGVRREFDAEITEQVPDDRIAWRSTGGLDHAGVVTFHRLDDNTTRIMFQLEMAPDKTIDAVAEKVGAVSLIAERDMRNFKEFIETRGDETGAWRGKVPREG
jgi:uncharacterized membrane protein